MFNLNDLKLVTSNENKLAEYNSFSNEGKISILKGLDLPEVESPDPLVVILHKSKMAGAGTIVEDTSLVVDGADFGTNIRWLLDDLDRYIGTPAKWIVKLAVNHDNNIYVYDGIINGTIVEKSVVPGFGFDPVFKPENSNLPLSDLSANGNKDDFSARKIAFTHLMNNNVSHVVKTEDIKDWVGAWQDDKAPTASKTKKFKM